MGYDFVPKIIFDFFTEISLIDDASTRLTRIKAFLHLLKEELRKVIAFKRELPLCMLLLKDVIEIMNEEAEHYEGREVGPMMKKFLSMNKCINSGEGGSKRSTDINDKKNWLRSAQLWNAPREKKEMGAATGILFKPCATRAGAFMPYKKQSDYPKNKGKEIMPDGDHGLTLSLPVGGMGYGSKYKNDASGSKSKQRRYWCPDLHKQFVSAVDQLGGAQAATPKQIRDIMQVDDLTNDEVKSHLQKYRLHIRRLPSTSSAPPPGLRLIPFDQLGDAFTSNNAQVAFPPGSLHLGGSTKAVSTTCGYGMEEDEDEDDKSEN